MIKKILLTSAILAGSFFPMSCANKTVLENKYESIDSILNKTIFYFENKNYGQAINYLKNYEFRNDILIEFLLTLSYAANWDSKAIESFYNLYDKIKKDPGKIEYLQEKCVKVFELKEAKSQFEKFSRFAHLAKEIYLGLAFVALVEKNFKNLEWAVTNALPYWKATGEIKDIEKIFNYLIESAKSKNATIEENNYKKIIDLIKKK